MEKLLFSYGMMIHRTLVWKRHTPKLMKWKKEVEMEGFQMTPNSREKGSLELRGLVWRRGRSSSSISAQPQRWRVTVFPHLLHDLLLLWQGLSSPLGPSSAGLCLLLTQRSSMEKILLYPGFSFSQAISSSASLHAGTSCGFMFA